MKLPLCHHRQRLLFSIDLHRFLHISATPRTGFNFDRLCLRDLGAGKVAYRSEITLGMMVVYAGAKARVFACRPPLMGGDVPPVAGA